MSPRSDPRAGSPPRAAPGTHRTGAHSADLRRGPGARAGCGAPRQPARAGECTNIYIYRVEKHNSYTRYRRICACTCAPARSRVSSGDYLLPRNAHKSPTRVFFRALRTRSACLCKLEGEASRRGYSSCARRARGWRPGRWRPESRSFPPNVHLDGPLRAHHWPRTRRLCEACASAGLCGR